MVVTKDWPYGLHSVFTVEPQSTAVAVGSDVVLGCSATMLDVGGGVLTPASTNYTWTLNGRSVPVKALQFYDHSLYVAPVLQPLAVRAHGDDGRRRPVPVPRALQRVDDQ